MTTTAASQESAVDASALSASERLAVVSQTIGRYALLLDQPDVAAWVELFHDDTWYRLISREQLDRGYTLYVLNENKQRLIDRIHWINRLWQLQEPTHTTHVLSVPVLGEATVDTIRATVPFALYRSGPETPPVIELAGKYETELVATDGSWLIRDHEVIVDTGVLPNALAIPV